jgi:3-methyladenine DNA glycosylase AlkD
MVKANIHPTAYLQKVKEVFESKGKPETAEGQRRYMRDQFDFYGLKAPEWVALARILFKENGLYEGDDLSEFSRLCFEDDYREIQYFSLQMTEKVLKKLPIEFIETLQELITSKSWWDTVDWISNFVGFHFQKFPDLQHTTCRQWMKTNNIWLQRVAIIHQLRYKEKTDFDLMKEMILEVNKSKEFFLQKASGWALRQYSKTSPREVIEFIETHTLAALTRREGLRLLKSKGIYPG